MTLVDTVRREIRAAIAQVHARPVAMEKQRRRLVSARELARQGGMATKVRQMISALGHVPLDGTQKPPLLLVPLRTTASLARRADMAAMVAQQVSVQGPVKLADMVSRELWAFSALDHALRGGTQQPSLAQGPPKTIASLAWLEGMAEVVKRVVSALGFAPQAGTLRHRRRRVLQQRIALRVQLGGTVRREVRAVSALGCAPQAGTLRGRQRRGLQQQIV